MHLPFGSGSVLAFTMFTVFVPLNCADAQTAPAAQAPSQPESALPSTPPPVVAATTSAPAAAQTETRADPDEIICKMTPPMTGTRLGAIRQCHTAREWAKRQEEAQRILAKAQKIGDQGMIPPPGGGAH